MIAAKRILLTGTAALLGGGAVLAPFALSAQEVVQALPDPAIDELNEALRRLSRSPDSLPALIQAGKASLSLDDTEAAKGFFDRARAVAPTDGRVLSGLAVVAVRQRNAVDAVTLFSQAERAGASLKGMEADRGLAYDLIGDNARAQGYYAEALSREESNELIRRLALSYAIAGNRDASEATLLPLLQRRDLAAYRSRAFALAILGKDEEAVSIIETMLPARLASRLTPYMKIMPRLTRAQQAAAANLGVFPPTAQIGRDDPALAAATAGASSAPPQQARASADERLIPGGPALGQAQTAVQQQQAANTAVAAAPAPTPTPTPAPVRREVVQQTPAPTPAPTPALARASTPAPVRSAAGELPAIGEPVASAPTPTPSPTPAQAASSTPTPSTTWANTPTPALSPALAQPTGRITAPVRAEVRDEPAVVARQDEPALARPSFSLADAEPAAPAPAAQPPAALPQQQEEVIDLSVVFADLDNQAAAAVTPQPDAVDITKLDIPLERKEPPAPVTPPSPQVPSRQWVQVATGQDTNAFRFDWRRIARGAGGLLDDRKAYFAPWGESNRLVTGPFDSAKAANDFVAELKAKGVDSFRFTSDAGEEVTEITNLPRIQSSSATVAPANPARHWVQVATGQNTGAFRFDWRRIARSAGGLLDGKDAFYAPWGQSNRLLTGPFASEKAANDFVAELKAKGVDAFRFASSQGEEVTALPSR